MRLAAATCVLLTAVSAANGQAPPAPDPLVARAKGRADAPVTVYEMSDFQCPYCRSFALTTMPLLEKEYVQTGKVRLVYINLPLTTRHPNAAAAAELAMCAARQGKFWPLHDLLFQRQDAWASRKDPAAYFLTLGDSAGLDHAQLARCVSAKATAALVREDAARAAAAGAVSTPTFYIEGGLLEGAAPVEVFRAVLDSVYRSKTTNRAR
jgi:protein-disulfide isomerase